ncbi:MAG: TIGR00730 family Rossman fold protein [Candidatus Kerfeldbacteria bacterium]|nr:TIGR00730 family Rossman fold protein [Candidatus Kerfeldbacteria bacterium]
MPKPSFTHTYQTPSQRKTYSQEEQTRKATLAGEVIHPSEFKSGRATWRIFRIMAEFVEGYNFLSKLTADITIFGSARTKPGEKYYKVAEKLGRLLAQEGFSVITGGGPGIMEAANKGAYEAGGESIGLGVQLPFEQRMNDYILHGIGFNFFFTRKVMLTSPSQAFIAFPGGYGTIDEIFEVLTLIKTHKMQPVPVILVGKEFWGQLRKFLKEQMLDKHQTINEEELHVFDIVDTAEEAIQILRQRIVSRDSMTQVLNQE